MTLNRLGIFANKFNQLNVQHEQRFHETNIKKPSIVYANQIGNY